MSARRGVEWAFWMLIVVPVGIVTICSGLLLRRH